MGSVVTLAIGVVAFFMLAFVAAMGVLLLGHMLLGFLVGFCRSFAHEFKAAYRKGSRQ